MKKKICTKCKKELSIDEFQIRKDNGRPKSWCRKCICSNIKNIQANKRKRAKDLFGNKCSKCGYNRCIEALEFHHIDSVNKEFTLSKMFQNKSWNLIEKELAKCILLCANCHREVHNI